MSGLQLFDALPDRANVVPLCSGKCGLGVSSVDGIIASNKRLGLVGLASSCQELDAAWAAFSRGDRNAHWHRKVYDRRASSLTCTRTSG